MVRENGLERLNRLEERLRRRNVVSRVPIIRLRDHSNPIEKYDSAQFKLRFHMFKETAIFITDLIKLDLNSSIKRGVFVPPIIQFLCVLRFFATGSFQIVIADLGNFSQSTISKLVKKISCSLAKQRSKFIKYPTLTQAQEMKSKFFEIGNFPGVVGCIDGTHVQINSPGGDNAELFRNRKGVFSVNVQGVCDADLNFTNIVARWYGSAHDSRIFADSDLYFKLENGESPGHLLGDAGYGCSKFLLTPLSNPRTQPEKRYQRAQLTTRNTIERTFGIWKMKFPCLRYLRTKLGTSLIIIIATAVLHNITRARGDLFLNDECDPEQNDPTVQVNEIQSNQSGRAFQKSIIENHFS